MKLFCERSFVNLSGFLFILSLLVYSSCREIPKAVDRRGNFSLSDDSVIRYNREFVQSESQEIDDFIKRYHWNMATTPTGLRYMIYKPGNGPRPAGGDRVSVNYTLKLLDGREIERSDSAHPLQFRLSTGKVPGGLEEGIMLMNVGARARLVVPSHLAFGLLGDLDKIPNRAVLVYDVELCRIN